MLVGDISSPGRLLLALPIPSLSANEVISGQKVPPPPAFMHPRERSTDPKAARLDISPYCGFAGEEKTYNCYCWLLGPLESISI